MVKLHFNKAMIGIDGKESPDYTLARVLWETLAYETDVKTLKYYGWYKDLQLTGVLQLDESDRRDLRDLIESHKRIFLYQKGQLIEAIDNAGNASQK